MNDNKSFTFIKNEHVRTKYVYYICILLYYIFILCNKNLTLVIKAVAVGAVLLVILLGGKKNNLLKSSV